MLAIANSLGPESFVTSRAQLYPDGIARKVTNARPRHTMPPEGSLAASLGPFVLGNDDGDGEDNPWTNGEAAVDSENDAAMVGEVPLSMTTAVDSLHDIAMDEETSDWANSAGRSSSDGVPYRLAAVPVGSDPLTSTQTATAAPPTPRSSSSRSRSEHNIDDDESLGSSLRRRRTRLEARNASLSSATGGALPTSAQSQSQLQSQSQSIRNRSSMPNIIARTKDRTRRKSLGGGWSSDEDEDSDAETRQRGNVYRGHRTVIVHPVKSSDTLAGIAVFYGIEMTTLKQANKLWANDSVHIRRYLYIPLDECRISEREGSVEWNESSITIHKQHTSFSDRRGSISSLSSVLSASSFTVYDRDLLSSPRTRRAHASGHSREPVTRSTSTVRSSPRHRVPTSPSTPVASHTTSVVHAELQRLPAVQLSYFPPPRPHTNPNSSIHNDTQRDPSTERNARGNLRATSSASRSEPSTRRPLAHTRPPVLPPTGPSPQPVMHVQKNQPVRFLSIPRPAAPSSYQPSFMDKLLMTLDTASDRYWRRNLGLTARFGTTAAGDARRPSRAGRSPDERDSTELFVPRGYNTERESGRTAAGIRERRSRGSHQRGDVLRHNY